MGGCALCIRRVLWLMLIIPDRDRRTAVSLRPALTDYTARSYFKRRHCTINQSKTYLWVGLCPSCQLIIFQALCNNSARGTESSRAALLLGRTCDWGCPPGWGSSVTELLQRQSPYSDSICWENQGGTRGVVQAFNPSTWEERQGDLCEFKAKTKPTNQPKRSKGEVQSPTSCMRENGGSLCSSSSSSSLPSCVRTKAKAGTFRFCTVS